MERVQVLIDKLVQQRQQSESIEQMLETVQLLQEELLAIQKTNKILATSKVAVVLPSRSPKSTDKPITIKPEEKPAEVVVASNPVEQEEQPPLITLSEPPNKVAERVQKEEVHKEDIQKEEAKHKEYMPKPMVPEVKSEPEVVKPAQPHLFDLQFDAFAETPTLVQHQPPRKELHEMIAEHKESLNDKLKQEKTEVAHLLKATPIKDLRKAIGVNDKFAFVNELFRGDEAMYERSIKTINNFHILPEAEYWINRELKVKLGWNEDREIVQHFYQLVRRRFL